jgi:hypothetical protein
MNMKTRATAPIILMWCAFFVAAGKDSSPSQTAPTIKKVEEYAAHQLAQGLAIAVDPLYTDALANTAFEYKNLVSKGILPVLVAIENRGEHTIRIEGKDIFLIVEERNGGSLRPMEIQYVFGRLKQGKKKSIPLPIPLPQKSGQLSGLDPKLEQLRARCFEMKLIPAGQRDYGYVYYDLPDRLVLQYVQSAYLPEVTDIETNQKLMFFEIDLRGVFRGAGQEKVKSQAKPRGVASFSFLGGGLRSESLQQAVQEQPAPAQPPVAAPPQSPVAAPPPPIMVPKKTEIVISLISLVSTRTAAPGDKFYGQISVPVIAEDRILIPVGSYIVGSVKHVKRAGRIRGDAELSLDFHSIIFPSGETRAIEARVRTADGYRSEEIQKSEGTIQGMPAKGKQLEEGAHNAVTGAMLGSIVVGGSSGSWSGAGTGGIIGAATGFGLTLLQRGPDVELSRGTQMTLTLDQDVNLTKK